MVPIFIRHFPPPFRLKMLMMRMVTNVSAVIETKDMHHGPVNNGQVADV